MKHTPRVFIDTSDEISEYTEIPTRHLTHFVSVLKLQIKDDVIIFNESGEFLSEVYSIKKNKIIVKTKSIIRKYKKSQNISLAFGIIKHDNARIIIEKATELGCSDFYPIITEYTNNHIKQSKLKEISILASEQSERLDIPRIHEELSFMEFVDKKVHNSKTLWISAIERSKNSANVKNIDFTHEVGFIIGCEGGFSEKEKSILAENTVCISLSDNVLRSETSAIACMSVWSVFK